MERDADVIVVGGGLSGAATAIGLARGGARVVVVDKTEFPRDKPCGEGLLPHVLAALADIGCGDVVDACGGQPFRGILYHCGGVIARGDFISASGAPTVGRGVRRRLLDEAVRGRAVAAGARLAQSAVRDVAVDEAGARVTLDDGAVLTAAVVVGADGPRSVTRHSLGLDGGVPRRPRYALRRHFHLAPGVSLPDRVEVHVGGGHELYVTPVEPGTVGVAALCERSVMTSGDGRPDDRLGALIARCPPLAARLAGAEPVGPALSCGPLRVRTTGVWRGRAVLVGDAAGYVDAITGEGMSLALKTASLASDAALAVLNGAAPNTAFARYARARSRAFFDHAALTHGLVWLARHPWFARRAIARLAQEPALFSRLLAVNAGERSLFSLGLIDGLKLAIGASPEPAYGASPAQ